VILRTPAWSQTMCVPVEVVSRHLVGEGFRRRPRRDGVAEVAAGELGIVPQLGEVAHRIVGEGQDR